MAGPASERCQALPLRLVALIRPIAAAATPADSDAGVLERTAGDGAAAASASEEKAKVTTPSAPDDVRLKYGTTAVLATPDANGEALGELHPGDAFRVNRQIGLFYAVSLPDGREGFVFVRNLDGAGLPANPAVPAPPHPSPVDATLAARLKTWLGRLGGRGA